MVIQFKVHGRLKSRVSEYESPCLELLVVKKITGDLPMAEFDARQLNVPDELELADPTFNVPGPVDILIGSGLFFKLLKHGQLEVEDHLPAVQETHLGWLVSGVVPTSHTNVGRALCTLVTEDDVGKLLERFWQFTAKLIMRELWLLDVRWDDPLPESMIALWMEFRSKLQQLNGFQIPRWLFVEGHVEIELHGFADASDLAYGACLYARSILDDGSAVMKLICSKSRILPKKEEKKEVTTPRAELQAAVLLARLTSKLQKALEVQFSKIVLWSDSQIVLCWIAKPPDALQVYVGNRVKEIQSATEDFEWRYIPSKSNPADLISRGVQPHLLESQQIWWSGPPILNQAIPPIDSPSPIPDENVPELKRTALVGVVANGRLKLFDNISRFSIIQRSMAYVIRFTDFIRSGKKVLTKGLPTADEMKRALLLIVRLVQRESFSTEIQALCEDKDFKLPLKCLNPFVDEADGTLRVGGRIRKACIPYDNKHQFLLPSKHPVTTAIIRHLHKSNLHLGQRGLLGVVRQQFWPLRAKDAIRNSIEYEEHTRLLQLA
nr:uncharacterized protein LOC115260405 [Aedes albopictus]